MIDVTQEIFYWFLIAYVVVPYLVHWAVDWIWFRFFDWHVAREVVRRRLFEEDVFITTASGQAEPHIGIHVVLRYPWLAGVAPVLFGVNTRSCLPTPELVGCQGSSRQNPGESRLAVSDFRC